MELDRLFMDCLVEIQKSYVKLSKQLRLRIEKWCEKLSNSGGSNLIWRKSRNDYARLLLGMIISNKFSEPFHMMPPDGPLPTFPSSLKSQLKESLGPHESSFWRHLYNSIEDSSVLQPARVIDEDQKVRKSDESFSRFAGIISNDKEIQSLSLLAREQEQRILILEQELRDERLSHELELQRINFAHRVEMYKNGSLRSVNSGGYIDVDSSSESFFAKTSMKAQEETHSITSFDRASISSFDPPSVFDIPFENNRTAYASSSSGIMDHEHTLVERVQTEQDDDEDFLNYIDGFQTEIKNISSSSSSSRR